MYVICVMLQVNNRGSTNRFSSITADVRISTWFILWLMKHLTQNHKVIKLPFNQQKNGLQTNNKYKSHSAQRHLQDHNLQIQFNHKNFSDSRGFWEVEFRLSQQEIWTSAIRNRKMHLNEWISLVGPALTNTVCPRVLPQTTKHDSSHWGFRFRM